ncbi:HRDC domain-containing protein [Candidatus Parcubacteria bacterium]|nr:HRDC domain-containing protein [Candidatus Parcubacteria bacterium]
MKQDQALHVMRRGKSVFLTGPAGSGKTHVLNRYIKDLKRQKKQVAITASTGIAATHINGTTIHSWSGLGIREELSSRDRAWLLSNSRLNKRYNATDVLIIDEVSMLHGKRLDMINEACKLLRSNPEPFGGMQLILTGDLFQLPPVNRDGNQEDFVHSSDAWKELEPTICYLAEQHRQRGGELLDTLEAMRKNDLRRKHLNYLQGRLNIKPADDLILTRLYAHNLEVGQINDEQLARLPGETHTYTMETKGRKKFIEQLQKSVLAPEVLELKIDAEVMFVANNFNAKFANGTRGKVVDFDKETGLPVVQLQRSKRRITVEQHSWSREEDGKIRASVSQLPLRLAWAITIHKSQGMSLDSALIDLSRSFTYGMGYVALSRVRSIEGLFLTGLNAMALKLHPEIFAYDATLRQLSSDLAEEIGEVAVEEIIEEKIQFDDTLFQKLREWRAERASSEGKPAFIIFHDKTLQEIAQAQPKSEQELHAINGIGPKKFAAYGEGILAITSNKQ